MKKLALGVLITLLLVVVADVVLSVFSTGLANKPSANHPSYTIAASKARGAFVSPVTITPSTIDWKGQQLSIKEAWLEHQTELVQITVIIPFVWEHYDYRKVDGFNLCLNLFDEGREVLWSYNAPFFVAKGGFAQKLPETRKVDTV